jgi:hypothetical protein
MQGTKTMTPAQRAKAAKDEMPDDKVLNQSMMFVMGEVFGWFNSNKDTIREALEQMADEGTVRVPRMATTEMIDAFFATAMPIKSGSNVATGYIAMIAAQESSSEWGGE